MDSQAASPEQLEREIAYTRGEIDRKLALLQARLSPRQVAGQMAHSFGSQGGLFARNLGATLRDNPVPTLLLGIGICWLMIAARNGARREEVDYRRDDSPQTADATAPRAAAALAMAEAAAVASAAPAARAPAQQARADRRSEARRVWTE